MSLMEIVKMVVMVLGSAVLFVLIVFGVGGTAVLLLMWALRKK